MTVKFEIKDQLAKLLATEDLVVEHKKVLTASFNVSTRVLVLPMWERLPIMYMICWLVMRLVMRYSHQT